jgi:two-component system NarL family sensor kinase
MTGIGAMIYQQSNELSQQQTATLERSLIDAKKAELRYYTAFARNSIANIYDNAGRNDDAAKQKVREILAKLSYGPDGYFFVYDYAGTNVVHPRQAYRIGKNWLKLKDPAGNSVIKDLIDAAKRGGGYTSYVWEKPSTGTLKKKIGYAIGLEKWGWMLGTGMYIDDVTSQVSVLEKDIVNKTTQAFLLVLTIVIGALAIVGGTGVFLTLQQHRAASGQLKALNQRIVETQEHERTRVARELHDGISQQLTSTKYVFELAQIQHARKNNNTATTISKGIDALAGAIAEIRRISKDLRPGALDDLGLAPALKTLCQEFAERSGLTITTEISPVHSLLTDDAKTALFRVAQEALNNVARHANADKVLVSLATTQEKVSLTIADNGSGFQPQGQTNGIGLKNMSERIAYYDGRFNISTNTTGTTVTASIAIVNPTRISTVAAE